MSVRLVQLLPSPAQINEYVERELSNHRRLLHPHIVQFKEARIPQGIPHEVPTPALDASAPYAAPCLGALGVIALSTPYYKLLESCL